MHYERRAPLNNIKKGISKALEILKKKSTPDEDGAIYVPLRTDSLLLDSVRAIEFSLDTSKVLVILCPRSMVKCKMSLVSFQTHGPIEPLLNLTPVLSLKRKTLMSPTRCPQGLGNP